MSVKPLDAASVTRTGHDLMQQHRSKGMIPDALWNGYEQADEGTRTAIELMLGDLFFFMVGVRREDVDEHPIIPILKGQVYGVDQGDEREGG